MPTEVTRAEFDELAQEVQGEKVVARYILEQTHRNGDDLAALKTRVGRIEVKVDDLDRKVDRLDKKVDALDGKVNQIDKKVDALAKGFPDIVRDTMREVLRERDQKR